MTLRTAIVGCGKIAEGHVEEIQKIDNSSVVAVCDREILMAEQLASRYGIERYSSDLESLLADVRPDVVHITTPPQSHLAIALQAIDAGCHVYVEKPLTVTFDEAKELVAKAESAKRKLTIGHTFQFDPPALVMRELIKKGVLGDPVHVESFMGYDLSGTFGSALLANGRHWVHDLPGTLFQNNINHLLTRITEFVQADRPDVHVMSYRRRSTRFGDRRDEMPDELRLMIRDEHVSAYGTFSSHIRPPGQFARVYGTGNTIHVDYVGRTVTVERGPTLPSAIGRLAVGFSQGHQYYMEGWRNVGRFMRSRYHFFSGLNQLITLFYESISNDSEPPIPYRDILRISWLMDEIIRQMKMVEVEV